MELFLFECKKIIKSYIYYVFIGVVLLFYISQMGFTNIEAVRSYSLAPKNIDIEQYYSENHRYPYGDKSTEVSMDTIPKIIPNLYSEYRANRYTTYPIGFAKTVRLSENKVKEIEKVLTEITGQSVTKLNEIYAANYMNPNFPVNSSLTIERFNEIMSEVDRLLGGGSAYSQKHIKRLTRVPVTYEEAVQNYEYLLKEDKLTNGYARLFCDYIGIAMSIFPIFVVVFISLKDKRSKMDELIYSRNTSSLKLVLMRYFALVFMMIIPIFIISLEPLIGFVKFSISEKVAIDAFAFAKYILWWLLPTLMLVTAIGVILTTLTDTPVAIAVQLLIWFLSLATIGFAGDYPLLGLLIRHNDSGMGLIIKENARAITMNRIAISVIALFLILITSYIYKQKRRGKVDFNRATRRLFKLNKNKY